MSSPVHGRVGRLAIKRLQHLEGPWLLDYRFRVIVFRRNSPDVAEFNRRVVMPTLGAYGQVFSIADNTLLTAEPGVNADSEGILSEVNYASDDPDNWKARVQEQLAAFQQLKALCFLWLDERRFIQPMLVRHAIFTQGSNVIVYPNARLSILGIS